MASPPIEALPTPALLLDRDRLEVNAERMRARAASLGVRLRPHFKTAKSLEVMAVALGEGPRVGAVSTFEEAGLLLEAGYPDVLCAVGTSPSRVEALDALDRAHAGELSVLTDDAEAAAALGRSREGRSRPLEVFIEIDSGQGRGGVRAESPALLEIARALRDAPLAKLRGVLTHAGHSYHERSVLGMARVAEEERSAAVRAAERLRADGHACAEVSVGSTPTAMHAAHLEGVTELRAGVYVFQDLFQARIGSCDEDALALSVLARIIARRPDEGVVWLDAGSLALSPDSSLASFDGGYGEVRALDGAPLPGRPRVDALNQVHGRVQSPALTALPIGTPVRVLPAHACLTAAMFDHYVVLAGDAPAACWSRLKG